jgi:hypothetical protein
MLARIIIFAIVLSILLPLSNVERSMAFVLDDRTRARMHEPTHTFVFAAYNICSERYEQCFDIWGNGNYNLNFTEVTGQGDYVKYIEKRTNVLESSWWRALDYVEGSDSYVIFKAEPAVKGSSLVGYIIIQVYEGENRDSGRICVYGNLFDKDNASGESDADCGSADVTIDPR